MKLDVWFTHDKGPYYVVEDRFDTIQEAEEFWKDTPFLISVELHGEKPPIVKQAGRYTQ